LPGDGSAGFNAMVALDLTGSDDASRGLSRACPLDELVECLDGPVERRPQPEGA